MERETIAAVTVEGTDAALTATLKDRLTAAGISVAADAPRRVTVVDARTPDAVTTVMNDAKALAAAGKPLDWWVVLATADTPAADGVRGLLRVVKNECPALSVHVVTLADTTAEMLARVTEMLSVAKSDADEVTVIAGRLAKSRVERVGALTHEKELPAVLTFDAPGQLERLYWQRTERKPLASDEIRVAVKATGLNFRDVMWAMGMLPEEALENGSRRRRDGSGFCRHAVCARRRRDGFCSCVLCNRNCDESRGGGCEARKPLVGGSSVRPGGVLYGMVRARAPRAGP